MIRDVAEQRLHGRPDLRQIVMLEASADVDQWPDRVAQTQQIAAQHVEPLDICARVSGLASTRSSIASTSSWIASSTGM